MIPRPGGSSQGHQVALGARTNIGLQVACWHQLHPGGYVRAFDRLDMARLFWNTLYYGFGALAFQLVFDVAAAYSLSKLRPALGNVIFLLMPATLMIPSGVRIIRGQGCRRG